MLPPATVPDAVTTSCGFLLVLSIAVPVAGVLLAFVLGDRWVRLVAFTIIPIVLAIVAATVLVLPQSKGPLVYLLGAWTPPLGVALRADGLSAVMLAATAVVISAVSVFAVADFRPTAAEPRAPFAFWILLLAIWGALNTIFVGGDLFTLYVALELLTFAAVPLVSLDGRPETLQAALRYLLFALLGSVLYLLGAALLYGRYGTLDIVLLSSRIGAEPASLVAAALMTSGLLAKTALFPLHLWLPPAHAGAPAAASAILSGLVVKGSFFIIVRLWFQVMPGLLGFAATQLLAALGAAAIVFGSVLALRQERLKLLIAYSTLAQIGYLFLMFPLALDASGYLESGEALAGGLLQAASHATAKAAMFMAAGSIYAGLGHDRITGLHGVARVLPLSVLAFAVAGIALMGVQPSGASLAKDLLLQVATETGQWWWAVVLQAGGIFTAAYVVLVLAHALASSDKSVTLIGPASRPRDIAALILALCSLLLGLVPWEPFLPVPYDSTSSLFGPGTLFKLLLPVLGGVVLAILLSPWPHPLASSARWKVATRVLDPFRRISLAFGSLVERGNSVLCEWPAASISLLVLALLFGALMLVAT
ncbi:NADH-quinone oxidoreductase subunit J [Bradyrhizobium rifense]|uniref:NADH-quinone oxidoreductase subunit J n=1 Tax=Bradyrhizobium rifense TaxID=515499 RepID=A0A5D3KDD2_9BRAD|nr:proton-conducting transporter membrane subunit [Bradyrhizobium rifense]TYL94663.1 NADH-quinone oxidoreductase subunit J [Bradyrhizobium rifense]